MIVSQYLKHDLCSQTILLKPYLLCYIVDMILHKPMPQIVFSVEEIISFIGNHLIHMVFARLEFPALPAIPAQALGTVLKSWLSLPPRYTCCTLTMEMTSGF